MLQSRMEKTKGDAESALNAGDLLDQSMQGTVRGGHDTAGMSKHGSMKTGRDGSDSMFDSMNNIDVRQSRDRLQSQ